MIFTKKNMQYRSSKSATPQLIAFERYLLLVTRMYYKKDLQFNENLFNISIDKKLSKTSSQEQEDFLINKIKQRKEQKPGRKSNKWRHLQKAQSAPVKNSENDEQTNKLNIDILDILISPLRSDYAFEKWSPKEIAIFESAFCRYGPEFSFIQHLIKTKTINQVNSFYEIWKKTSHYKAWKYFFDDVYKNNYNSWL